MNQNESNTPKRGKGGRTPKNDPANFRYSVNFTAVQHAQFLTLFEQSGLQSKARFIAARIFGDEFRVVKTDLTTLEKVQKKEIHVFEYYMRMAITLTYQSIIKWTKMTVFPN
jgi:hypothetical protein